MTWILPISQITGINLGTTDSALIMPNVAIGNTINGTGSFQSVIVYGSVGVGSLVPIHLGDSANDTNNLIEIKPGAQCLDRQAPTRLSLSPAVITRSSMPA